MTTISSPEQSPRQTGRGHRRGRRHKKSPVASSLCQNPWWTLSRRRRVTCLLVWLLSLLGLVVHMGIVLRWSVRFQSLQQLLPQPPLVLPPQPSSSIQLLHVLHTRLWHHETAAHELEALAKAQFHVFRTWTLASVLHQSNSNVWWIIWIDPATPRDWTQRLVTLLQDHQQQPDTQPQPEIVVVASRVADIPPLRSSFYQPPTDGRTIHCLQASFPNTHDDPINHHNKHTTHPQLDPWYSRGLPASSIVHGSRVILTDLWHQATRDNGTTSIVLETVLEADQAISYNWVDTIQREAWQSLGQRPSTSTSTSSSSRKSHDATVSHRQLRDYRCWCAPQVLVWQHDGSHRSQTMLRDDDDDESHRRHYYQQPNYRKKKNLKDHPQEEENGHSSETVDPSSAAGRFQVWNYAKKRPPTHAHPDRDLEDEDRPHSVDSRIVPSTASYLTTCPSGAFTIGYGVGTWPHHLPTTTSTSSSSTDRVRGDETAKPLSLSWSFSSETPPPTIHGSHGSTKPTLLSRSQVVRQLPPCEFVQFQCWSRLLAPSGAAAPIAVVRAVSLASLSVRSSAMVGKRRGNRHSNKDKNHKTDSSTNQDPPLGWSWLFDTFGVKQSQVQALDRALSATLCWIGCNNQVSRPTTNKPCCESSTSCRPKKTRQT